MCVCACLCVWFLVSFSFVSSLVPCVCVLFSVSCCFWFHSHLYLLVDFVPGYVSVGVIAAAACAGPSFPFRSCHPWFRVFACYFRLRVVSGSTCISTFSLIVFLVTYRLGVLLPLPVSLLRRGCRQPALAPQSAAKPQTTTNGVVAVVCSGLGCRDVVKLPGWGAVQLPTLWCACQSCLVYLLGCGGRVAHVAARVRRGYPVSVVVCPPSARK